MRGLVAFAAFLCVCKLQWASINQIDKGQFKGLLKKCLEKAYDVSGAKAEAEVVTIAIASSHSTTRDILHSAFCILWPIAFF